MKRLWLLFAQSVTVLVAAYFVVATLQPSWLHRSASLSSTSAGIALIEAPPANMAQPAVGSFSAAARKASPAVVSINTSKAAVRHPRSNDPWFQFFFGDQENQPQAGLGSGVIISPDGYILTNNHVISMAATAGAGEATINVYFVDGSISPAQIVGRDPQADLAVLQVDKPGRVPIDIGKSANLHVRDEVVAFGSPLGLAGTVTSGIVSAENRPMHLSGEGADSDAYVLAVQTDASINPGNSGGALVNMEGKLVGIPSVIASLGGSQGQSGSIGLGFAIPSNQAQRIAQDLIETGKTSHPVIGAKVNTGSDIFGAEIADVDNGSPAEEAGLKKGDVVTRVDDRPVESGVGLIAAIRSHKVGDTVEMTVTDSNGRNEHTVNVTLGAE